MESILLFVALLLCSITSATTRAVLPRCTPKNLKLADFAEGIWELKADGTFALTFPHCDVHTFSGAEASKCLGGDHLVFMGDSISRYMYMSLVTLLADGEWGARLTSSTNASFPRSTMWEKDYNSWADFYTSTNRRLNNNLGQGTATAQIHQGVPTSYEVCDCYRDDNAPYSEQRKSVTENRHFRQYVRPTTHRRKLARASRAHTAGGDDRASAALEHDRNQDNRRLGARPGRQFPGGQRRKPAVEASLLRVSYIQFLGPGPLRGRTALSSKLPPGSGTGATVEDEDAYRSYVDRIGRELCPSGASNSTKGDDGLVPISASCSNALHQGQASGATKFDFPSVWSAVESDAFESEVLHEMGASHLLLNLGWHAQLMTTPADAASKWLKQRVTAVNMRQAKRPVVHQPKQVTQTSTDRYLNRPGTAAYSAAKATHIAAATRDSVARRNPMGKLQLPRVTWRGTTAFGTSGVHNDGIAAAVRDELQQDAKAHQLGFMPMWELTARLWSIDNWIATYGGKLSVEQYLKERGGDLRGRDSNNSPFATRNDGTDSEYSRPTAQSSEKKMQDLLALRFNVDPTVPVELVLPKIYLDHAHYQPFVYNEINNAFLNSVCLHW